MIKNIRTLLIIITALLFQITIFPPFLLDPFKPNLLILLVVHLGLRSNSRLGGLSAFSIGILQDCFSGIYLGLSGFSYLSLFFALNKTADRLYTDSRYLMVIVTFLATIFNGLLQLLLLFIFSAANGIYSTILPALVPQALMNALIGSLIFMLPVPVAAEEAKIK